MKGAAHDQYVSLSCVTSDAAAKNAAKAATRTDHTSNESELDAAEAELAPTESGYGVVISEMYSAGTEARMARCRADTRPSSVDGRIGPALLPA